MKHVIDGNFIFEQYSALMLIAFNTVQLLQCKHPSSFLSGQLPQNGPELNSDVFREPHSSNSMSGESWMQMYMDNGVGVDREKGGSTS